MGAGNFKGIRFAAKKQLLFNALIIYKMATAKKSTPKKSPAKKTGVKEAVSKRATPMKKKAVPKKAPAKKAPAKKAAPKKIAAKKSSPAKKNKLGVKNSLVNNINAHKKAGNSKPKKKSTVAKGQYKDMENNWQ